MAVVISQPPPLTEPLPSGYSKTNRRQYQACDQCRKSRRACDALVKNVANFPFREDEQSEPSIPLSDACSNCERTSKRCTFAWLANLVPEGLPKGVKRKLENISMPKSNPDIVSPSSYQITSSNSAYPSHDASTLRSLLPPTSSFLPVHHLQRGMLTGYHAPSIQTSSGTYLASPSTSLEVHQIDDGSASTAMAFSDGSMMSTSVQHNPEFAYLAALLSTEDTAVDCWSRITTGFNNTSSTSSSSTKSLSSSNTTIKADTSPRTSVTSGPTYEPDPTPNSPPKKAKRRRIGREASTTTIVDDSASVHSRSLGISDGAAISSATRQLSAGVSLRQRNLSDAATREWIHRGLVRIYHDSFENSLSCWVTEQNCPYEIELKDFSSNASLTTMAEETAFRLGDNRILSRVSRLDSAFARLRGRPMSKSEDRSATRALNAAVMAFASQWSHGSHNSFWKSQEGLSQLNTCQSQTCSLFARFDRSENMPLPVEYEQWIQKKLWHEAWTAIQASAEVDSFKVILAYMLFSLTQRPTDLKHKSGEDVGAQSTDQENASPFSSGFSASEAMAWGIDSARGSTMDGDWDPFYANDLEARVSPPIHLEAAVRNLSAWRRKIERHRRLRSNRNHSLGRDSMGLLAVKDHQTFNLLFWLGVMCDTTSAAITKRPLVIPDEDCAVIRGIAEADDDQFPDESSRRLSFQEDD